MRVVGWEGIDILFNDSFYSWLIFIISFIVILIELLIIDLFAQK